MNSAAVHWHFTGITNRIKVIFWIRGHCIRHPLFFQQAIALKVWFFWLFIYFYRCRRSCMILSAWCWIHYAINMPEVNLSRKQAGWVPYSLIIRLFLPFSTVKPIPSRQLMEICGGLKKIEWHGIHDDTFNRWWKIYSRKASIIRSWRCNGSASTSTFLTGDGTIPACFQSVMLKVRNGRAWMNCTFLKFSWAQQRNNAQNLLSEKWSRAQLQIQ